MPTLIVANLLIAPGAGLLHLLVFFGLPLAGFGALEARALKRLDGTWKLLALAPAVLVGAVVYLLVADALISFLLGREPQEGLISAFLFAAAAGAAIVALLLAGHRLRPPARRSMPISGNRGARYRR